MFNRALVSRCLVDFTYHLHLNFPLGELQQHFYGIFRLTFSIRRIDLENLKSDTNERDACEFQDLFRSGFVSSGSNIAFAEVWSILNKLSVSLLHIGLLKLI